MNINRLRSYHNTFVTTKINNNPRRMRKYVSGKCDLLAKIALENYPPYLTKDKIYRMKGSANLIAIGIL